MKKKTKITFIFGPLYCVVNYLFCCWRRSPMRLFHKWWRLCIFFVLPADALFMSQWFSCCHSLSRTQQLPFPFGRTGREALNTTQCNTIFSFWQLFSNDVFRWNLISSARKNSTFHQKPYFNRKIITPSKIIWNPAERKSAAAPNNSPWFNAPLFPTCFNGFHLFVDVECIHFHSPDFICNFPPEKRECEINYSSDKIATTLIEGCSDSYIDSKWLNPNTYVYTYNMHAKNAGPTKCKTLQMWHSRWKRATMHNTSFAHLLITAANWITT